MLTCALERNLPCPMPLGPWDRPVLWPAYARSACIISPWNTGLRPRPGPSLRFLRDKTAKGLDTAGSWQNNRATKANKYELFLEEFRHVGVRTLKIGEIVGGLLLPRCPGER